MDITDSSEAPKVSRSVRFEGGRTSADPTSTVPSQTHSNINDSHEQISSSSDADFEQVFQRIQSGEQSDELDDKVEQLWKTFEVKDQLEAYELLAEEHEAALQERQRLSRRVRRAEADLSMIAEMKVLKEQDLQQLAESVGVIEKAAEVVEQEAKDAAEIEQKNSQESRAVLDLIKALQQRLLEAEKQIDSSSEEAGQHSSSPQVSATADASGNASFATEALRAMTILYNKKLRTLQTELEALKKPSMLNKLNSSSSLNTGNQSVEILVSDSIEQRMLKTFLMKLAEISRFFTTDNDSELLDLISFTRQHLDQLLALAKAEESQDDAEQYSALKQQLVQRLQLRLQLLVFEADFIKQPFSVPVAHELDQTEESELRIVSRTVSGEHDAKLISMLKAQLYRNLFDTLIAFLSTQLVSEEVTADSEAAQPTPEEQEALLVCETLPEETQPQASGDLATSETMKEELDTMVDTAVAAEVFTTCLERQCRKDCVEVVARVLQLSQEQRVRVGLDLDVATQRSYPAWSKSKEFSSLFNDFVRDEIS